MSSWLKASKTLLRHQIEISIQEYNEAKNNPSKPQPWLFFLGYQENDLNFRLLNDDYRLVCCLINASLRKEPYSTIASRMVDFEAENTSRLEGQSFTKKSPRLKSLLDQHRLNQVPSLSKQFNNEEKVVDHKKQTVNENIIYQSSYQSLSSNNPDSSRQREENQEATRPDISEVQKEPLPQRQHYSDELIKSETNQPSLDLESLHEQRLNTKSTDAFLRKEDLQDNFVIQDSICSSRSRKRPRSKKRGVFHARNFKRQLNRVIQNLISLGARFQKWIRRFRQRH